MNGERNGKGKEFKYGKLIFNVEYLKVKKWNGQGFDGINNIVYVLKDGKGIIKEYNNNEKLEFEREYLNGGKMEREKNINMVN